MNNYLRAVFFILSNMFKAPLITGNPATYWIYYILILNRLFGRKGGKYENISKNSIYRKYYS
jgi:hypothetical protein